MSTLREYIDKNASLLKYGGLALAILTTIVATRTYLNYTYIQTAIEDVNTNIKNVNEEMNFTENFLIKYLGSDYADYFIAHENNILFKGESIIQFDDGTQDAEDEKEAEENKTDEEKPAQTAQESRKIFLKEKMGKKE